MQNLMLKQRRKVPPVILLMLLFLFAVYFLLNNFVSERGYFFIIQNTSFMPLRFSEGEAWWSLLTYSFLHNGWEHLLMNSLWFLAIGIPVSLRIGGWFRFVFFYLFCCICAALFYWLFNSDASVLMIGASGGVAGIMGAAVRFIFKQPGDNLFRLHPPRARVMYIHECLKTPRVLMFIVIWIMVNIIFGTMGMVVQGEVISIAWQAHIGGFLAGFLFFTWFDKTPRSETGGLGYVDYGNWVGSDKRKG